MRRLIAIALILAAASPLLATEEKPLSTKIDSLGLFKNGLAVVRRTAQVDGPGVYCISDAPEPVHGTYWIESDAKVTTRATHRLVDAPAGAAVGDFQEELAGREVEIRLADAKMPVLSGTVVAMPRPPVESSDFSRRYERSYYGYWNYSVNGRPSPDAASRFLVLKTNAGLSYIDATRIAYLQAKGANNQVPRPKRRKAVLLLTVGPTGGKPATISISYLAKGIAWAPSYRVDLTDPKTLVLRQNAAIKNELETFEGARLQLISGYPNIRFGHVVSPLSPETTWATFFGQLNQQFARGGNAMSNVISQQAVMVNRPEPGRGIDLSAAPAGEGVDLHYRDIGPQSMDLGDTLAVDTTSGKAKYERIVEWFIPDTRQADGDYVSRYQRESEPEKYEDAVWDAVRFDNPLEGPMTTAPAMIVADGRFHGQQMSYWVDAGEQTTLRVTKALSIRAKNVEKELADSRQPANYLGDPHYWKVTIEGRLMANNHRREPITMVVRRQFSGELLNAEGDPKKTLLEEGAGFVNQRNELTWTITVKPGEEIKRVYRYTMLIRR
ncbi:MAG: hypothetical protein JW818_14915 [Pirellulales bacterium]|nr:hypothetical protein [Pirellulales bacterium]